MAAVVMQIEVHVLDSDAEHGLWCTECHLPSVVRRQHCEER